MEDEIVVVKFLTPYKVALVAVILLYCDGVIPDESKMKIMCHLVGFIDPQQHDNMENESIVLLDGDLAQLHSIMGSLESKISGVSLFDLLLDFLFEMTSLDSLHTFMSRIDEYLIHGDGKHDSQDEQKVLSAEAKSISLLKQSSLLGSYCKRCYLAFEGLSFDAVLHLWQYLEMFRAPYEASWNLRRSVVKSLKGDIKLNIMLPENDQDSDDDASFLKSLVPQAPLTRCIAGENLEALLEFQIGVFERYGGTLPEEIRHVLNSMVSTNKPLPTSAHYVQYLDAFRDKDYEAAFDHLHRFYDYTMNSRGRTHYQYALFTLATLQAEFSFYTEAMRAVEEAITVARENKDNNCLNYILSWLYSFLQSHPDCTPPESLSSQEQISQFLRIKSKETSYSLYSLSYQSEVEQLMAQGGSLTQAFEALTKSTYINAVSNSSFAAGNVALVASGLWTRLGNSTLAKLALDMYSHFPDRQLNALLTIEIGVRKAKLFFQEGNLPECFKLLGSLKSTAHGSQWHQQIWYPKFLILHLHHKLNEERLEESRFILEKLSGIAASDTEVNREIEYYKFLLELKSGNVSIAMDGLWSLLESSKYSSITASDVMYQVRLMLFYAKILIEYTDKSTRALSLVLKLINMTEEASLATYEYESVVMLACISNSQNEPGDALSMVDAIMPRVSITEL